MKIIPKVKFDQTRCIDNKGNTIFIQWTSNGWYHLRINGIWGYRESLEWLEIYFKNRTYRRI